MLGLMMIVLKGRMIKNNDAYAVFKKILTNGKTTK